MNAANRKDVAEFEKRRKIKRRQELDDIRFLLSSAQGRRFIWRLIAQAEVFHSIWSPSAQVHYNAGKQDFGHFIMAEVTEADETYFIKMMQESLAEKNAEKEYLESKDGETPSPEEGE